MSKGDVLSELRAWRDEFARSHGYDVHAMAAALRELDSASERKVVRGEPRPPAAARTPKPLLQPTGSAIAVPPSAKPLDVATAAEL